MRDRIRQSLARARRRAIMGSLIAAILAPVARADSPPAAPETPAAGGAPLPPLPLGIGQGLRQNPFCEPERELARGRELAQGPVRFGELRLVSGTPGENPAIRIGNLRPVTDGIGLRPIGAVDEEEVARLGPYAPPVSQDPAGGNVQDNPHASEERLPGPAPRTEVRHVISDDTWVASDETLRRLEAQRQRDAAARRASKMDQPTSRSGQPVRFALSDRTTPSSIASAVEPAAELPAESMVELAPMPIPLSIRPRLIRVDSDSPIVASPPSMASASPAGTSASPAGTSGGPDSLATAPKAAESLALGPPVNVTDDADDADHDDNIHEGAAPPIAGPVPVPVPDHLDLRAREESRHTPAAKAPEDTPPATAKIVRPAARVSGVVRTADAAPSLSIASFSPPRLTGPPQPASPPQLASPAKLTGPPQRSSSHPPSTPPRPSDTTDLAPQVVASVRPAEPDSSRHAAAATNSGTRPTGGVSIVRTPVAVAAAPVRFEHDPENQDGAGLPPVIASQGLVVGSDPEPDQPSVAVTAKAMRDSPEPAAFGETLSSGSASSGSGSASSGLASSGSASSGSGPGPVATHSLVMRVSEVRTLTVDAAIGRFQVADTSVCQVLQAGDRRLKLIATGTGVARLRVWLDEAGDTGPRPLAFDVTVEGHRDRAGIKVEEMADRLQDSVRQVFPDADVRIRPRQDRLVVSGVCDDRDTATAVLRLIRRSCLVPVMDELRVR